MSGNKRPWLWSLLLLVQVSLGAPEEDPAQVLGDFSSAGQQRVALALGELGHEQSAVRREARKTLRESRALTRARLAAALQSDDPEIHAEAALLAETVCGPNEKRLERALIEVAAGKVRVPAAMLLEISSACGETHFLDLHWKRAFLAMCTPGDADLLGTLSQSDRPAFREIALTAVQRLALPSARELLRTGLRDPVERVRLLAASELLYAGDATALECAVELLSSESTEMRGRAFQLLRSTTGQPILFRADAPEADRRSAIAEWRGWLKDNARKPLLTRDRRASGDIVPASDQDLALWIFRTPDTRDQWSIQNEILSCAGKKSGVLICPVPLRNYHLSYEWRWPEGNGDSGLFLGIDDPGADSLNAMEVQMLAGREGDFWRIGNFLPPRNVKMGGMIPRTGDIPRGENEEWFVMDLKVSGGRVEVRVNGLLVNTFDGLPDQPSHFGFQMENSPFEVRRIKVKPLP